MKYQRARTAFFVGFIWSCTSAPQPASELGKDIVARVGSSTIPTALVTAVAVQQHVSPKIALDRLITDAVAANEARARGLERNVSVRWAIQASASRSVAEHINIEARSKGPPTEEEVDVVAAHFWPSWVDKIIVVHAVVRPKKNNDPSGAQVAEEIRGAVVSSADAATFEKAVHTVDWRGFDVRVETLPEFSARDGQFDFTFVHAAFAIDHVGEISPVVQTQFGWHVIRLVEKHRGNPPPFEVRRDIASGEIYIQRSRELYGELLEKLHATTAIHVDPAAEELMATVSGL